MELTEIKSKIAPILREYGVAHASVFGSVSRGEAGPESDVDLVVKLGQPIGLFAFTRLNRELAEVLGRKVDLVTESSLDKFIRPYVLPELKTVYEGR